VTLSTIANPLAALAGYLRAIPELQAACGARVFAQALPGQEAPQMPRTAVVLRSSGGPGTPRNLPLLYVRLDAVSYGRTYLEADNLGWVVHAALNGLDRVETGGTLLHALVSAGGPISVRDPDTEWPQVVSTWTLMAAEAVTP